MEELKVMMRLLDTLVKDEKDPEAAKTAILEGVVKDYNCTPIALALKIEVNTEKANSSQKKVLTKYGSMRDSISRTLLVPYNIPLHALHYAIMKAFGWKNCQPHCFAPDKEDYLKMTGGVLAGWLRLCGIYFRYPDCAALVNESDDICHDDADINTWLKSKYCAPYSNSDLTEYYPIAQLAVGKFLQAAPKSALESRKVDEWPALVGGACDSLVERSMINEIMLTPNSTFDWKDWTEQKKKDLEKAEKERKTMLPDFLERLQHFQGLENLSEEDYDKEEYASLKEESEMLAVDASMSSPKQKPSLRTMKYRYGSEHGWELNISCTNAWYHKSTFKRDQNGKLIWDNECGLIQENTIYMDESEQEVSGEFLDKLLHVHEEGEPACIACDGLNLLENLDGLNGFCDFLEAINGKDCKSKNDALTLAKSQGWTGSMPKAENIL